MVCSAGMQERCAGNKGTQSDNPDVMGVGDTRYQLYRQCEGPVVRYKLVKKRRGCYSYNTNTKDG